MADQERGAGQPQWSLAPYQVNVQYGASAGIARGTGADWFGPLDPMAPVAPPDVAGRQFDYQPGFNLALRPRAYEPISFHTLRQFADAYDLLRLVIETRKDQIERMQWAIKPRDPRLQRKSKSLPGAVQSRVDAIEKFFRKPDGYTPWKTWLRSLLEDMFVLDAATLYCQRTRGGKLFALPQLDGATIKRVIDDWGRTPVPFSDGNGGTVYPPAYQQILKGMPAVNYSTRDLIYRPRNVRAHRVYGYSPVQQILMTVQIALRRQVWQLDYYTEGSIPDAFMAVPENWTPDQIRAYQQYWDTEFTGDLAKRRRVKFVPGSKPNVVQTKEPEQKNDFDEWLARIVCFAFSVPPTWAVKMRSAASDTSKQSDQSDEEGVEPTKEWVKDIADGIIVDEFNSPDLEFTWIEQGDVDPVKQEALLEGRVKTGAIVVNEFRDALGLDPYDNPAANIPMVLTSTGYVPIDANTIEGKQANIDAFGAPPAATPFGAPAQESADPDGANGTLAAKKPVKGDEADAEKLNRTIPFSKARARRLAPVPFDRAAVKAAVTGISGKLAKVFAKLQRAVIAAVKDDLGKLAKDKKKDKKPKAKARKITTDLDFAALIDATSDIGDDLSALSTDSGQLALAQLGVDDASNLVNQVNDAAVAAAQDQAGELVSGIDDRTRAMLADIIADGLSDNIGTDAIADAIVDSGLFSEERADLIARTEVSRANSQAALAGYRTARDKAGVNVKKAWFLGPNPCEICEGNADDGDIDLDDDFSSGDDAAPAHPNCECAVSPVVED
jgi:hypothetical protein